MHVWAFSLSLSLSLSLACTWSRMDCALAWRSSFPSRLPHDPSTQREVGGPSLRTGRQLGPLAAHQNTARLPSERRMHSAARVLESQRRPRDARGRSPSVPGRFARPLDVGSVPLRSGATHGVHEGDLDISQPPSAFSRRVPTGWPTSARRGRPRRQCGRARPGLCSTGASTR